MFPRQSFNTLGQLRYGPMIYNRHDTLIGRSIELYGEFALVETSVLAQLISPGQLVIDANAHSGLQTLFLARKVGPEGRVLAFEAQRLLFQTLCGNLALSSIANTHCWNAALGALEGEIRIPLFDPLQPHDSRTLLRRAEKDEPSEIIPVVTIDSFQLPRCDVIRIDDPAAAQEILRGGEATIARHKPVLYLSCRADRTDTPVLEQLQQLGYGAYRHNVPLFNPNNHQQNTENVFGEEVLPKLLCFDAAAEHRLTGFTPVEMPRAA